MSANGMQTKQQTLREILDAQGRSYSWVAERCGLTGYQFTYNVLNRGRATPQESEKLAVAIGLPIEAVNAALAETARRFERGDTGGPVS